MAWGRECTPYASTTTMSMERRTFSWEWYGRRLCIRKESSLLVRERQRQPQQSFLQVCRNACICHVATFLNLLIMVVEGCCPAAIPMLSVATATIITSITINDDIMRIITSTNAGTPGRPHIHIDVRHWSNIASQVPRTVRASTLMSSFPPSAESNWRGTIPPPTI